MKTSSAQDCKMTSGLLTAVLENNVYNGYQWSSYTNSQRLLNTLKAFFDEAFWFGTLEWTKIKWETEVSA